MNLQQVNVPKGLPELGIFGLTIDGIRRHVVSVAPSFSVQLKYKTAMKEKRLAKGLRADGKPFAVKPTKVVD